jgi:hypothetical protein
MMMYGAGLCSLCKSPGTNKRTCPLNPNISKEKHNYKKHYLVNESDSDSWYSFNSSVHSSFNSLFISPVDSSKDDSDIDMNIESPEQINFDEIYYYAYDSLTMSRSFVITDDRLLNFRLDTTYTLSEMIDNYRYLDMFSLYFDLLHSYGKDTLPRCSTDKLSNKGVIVIYLDNDDLKHKYLIYIRKLNETRYLDFDGSNPYHKKSKWYRIYQETVNDTINLIKSNHFSCCMRGRPYHS